MNLKTLSIMCTLFVCLISFIGWAGSSSIQPSDSPDYHEPDENDTEIRENPVIETSDDDPGISVPDFVNAKANHINMNGANWSKVRKRLSECRQTPFSIVHIGDSHLQADIATGTIRELMQYDYGNAGRGLVVPFKMASTNAPWDYTISSHGDWKAAKILRRPWSLPMWFTGISIQPLRQQCDLYVATRDDDDYNPFSSLVVFHTGTLTITEIENRDGEKIAFNANKVSGGTLIRLSGETSGVRLFFESQDCAISGINLSGNRPGIFYHTIGNNGATYASYNNIPEIGAGIKLLRPDLIVVSLGTNEAFGHFDRESFIAGVDKLINNIKASNPEAQILLTTPMECQKSVYSTSTKKVKKKVRVPVNKKGKKRKYKTETRTVNHTTRVHSYGVNKAVLEVRNAILKYGKDHGIAVYDWYLIAGGENASEIWLQNGLYGKDRVHHTSKGYRLQGYMLYEAIKSALTNN